MAWSAVVEETRPQGTAYVSFVKLSDGVTGYRESFVHDGSVGSLRQGVLAYIAASTARSGKLALIPAGTAIDCSPDAAPAPSVATPRDTFLANWSLYQSYKRGNDASLIDAKTLSDQLAVVQSLYLAAYAGSL